MSENIQPASDENKINENQRQHSDKNVFKNIDEILKEIINEKN